MTPTTTAPAAVTFDDARRIAEDTLRPTWPADHGTFTVSPYGWEDATHWRVEAGAREYLVNGDDDFCPLDGPAYLVDKATGALTQLPILADGDRIRAMRRVGEHPDDGR